MTVDPDRVIAIPMPRNPAPVSSTSPIARAMDVIRLIADSDTDPDCIRGRGKAAHTNYGGKK